jgi:DnaJ-domain-containing protein 1
MAKKFKYTTMSDVLVTTSISEIREELAKIGVNGMDVDCRYDLSINKAMVKFTWEGKQYQRSSTNQPNVSKNMRVICLNLKHKVLDHLRGVEDFGNSMQAYLAIGGEVSQTAQASVQLTPEIIAAYAILEITPYASKEECETAYKRHIKAWHPDRYANDEMMKDYASKQASKINDAWDKIQKQRGMRTG